jgi:hypothetical protein
MLIYIVILSAIILGAFILVELRLYLIRRELNLVKEIIVLHTEPYNELKNSHKSLIRRINATEVTIYSLKNEARLIEEKIKENNNLK